MNRPTLIRHPRLHKRESFLGYVLRLSEVNGYSSPRHLRQFAGIASTVSLVSVEGLVALASVSRSMLPDASAPIHHGLAVPTLTRPVDADFIPTAEWTLIAKCCPLCIEAMGFIEAHWSLPHMIACPLHRYLAASLCFVCKRPLRWHRPGLLECSCGATIRIDSARFATSTELALLDLIRRKALGLESPKQNPAGFPIENLMTMTLPQLIETVDTLARLQGAATGRDKRQVVFLAARALSDWPHGFLKVIDPQEDGTERAVQFRRNLARCLRALCGPNSTLRSHADFLGAVMVEYAVRQWNYRPSQLARYDAQIPTGVLDHLAGEEVLKSTLASSSGVATDGLVDASDAAQYLGCSTTTIEGLVRAGRLQGNVHATKWKVEGNSLRSFRRDFVFLDEVARLTKKSMRIVRLMCQGCEISVSAPRTARLSGRSLYMRAADVDRLKQALHKHKGWRMKVHYMPYHRYRRD